MPLPASWTTVPVTWTITGHDGTPAKGVVRFTSAQVVTADGGTYVPAPITARVTDGVMESVNLPTTDDPDISPTGWTWRVQPLTSPDGPEAFNILVPAAGGPINLATVVPVSSPTPLSAVAIGDQFIAGRVNDATSATRTALNGQYVRDDQLDTGTAANVTGPSQTRTALDAAYARIGADSAPRGASAALALDVPTYDGNPSAGHPSVLYFPSGWNGWKYWMAFTPFPTSTRENPSVVVSDDGVKWQVPTGLTNPVHPLSTATAMGYDYWADTELEMSADGLTMMMYFKGTDTGVANHYVLSTSTDGTTWTAPSVVVTDAGVSPAVIREADDTFTMLEINNSTIARRTSANGTTWTAATAGTIPTLPSPYTLWHLDVCKADGVYHALVTGSVPTGTGPYRQFYWTSTDGLTWTGNTTPAVPLSGTRLDSRGHYRSAILPAVSGHADRFDLWLTGMDDTRTNHDSAIWRISLIRDYDFGSTTWAFPPEPSDLAVRETDERWVMSTELVTTLGAPPSSVVSNWPVKGLRHTASDGLGALFPPVPPSWSHFIYEALVVNGGALAGDVCLPSRHEVAGAGDTLTTGSFKQVFRTLGAQNVPKWIELVQSDVADPVTNKFGRPSRITIERSWGNAGDTFDDTLWIIAVRIRRFRDA